ncbi:MAG: hypothetical protein A2Y25_01325 [Candidatus Melainabacteria bacterium GWF2_37_15]|nr:MAG: hypothetical protein A2Y25_01325 [Candidatus Melainabacteria bacterium GWF2_37_15]
MVQSVIGTGQDQYKTVGDYVLANKAEIAQRLGTDPNTSLWGENGLVNQFASKSMDQSIYNEDGSDNPFFNRMQAGQEIPEIVDQSKAVTFKDDPKQLAIDNYRRGKAKTEVINPYVDEDENRRSDARNEYLKSKATTEPKTGAPDPQFLPPDEPGTYLPGYEADIIPEEKKPSLGERLWNDDSTTGHEVYKPKAAEQKFDETARILEITAAGEAERKRAKDSLPDDPRAEAISPGVYKVLDSQPLAGVLHDNDQQLWKYYKNKAEQNINTKAYPPDIITAAANDLEIIRNGIKVPFTDQNADGRIKWDDVTLEKNDIIKFGSLTQDPTAINQ